MGSAMHWTWLRAAFYEAGIRLAGIGMEGRRKRKVKLERTDGNRYHRY